MKKLRLFFALWPPAQTARALHAWALEAQIAAGGKVTPADSIHLTLAFLGEVLPENLDSVLQAAHRVGAKRHALMLEQAEYRPRNRIVWASPREIPPALGDLAEQLARHLKESGFSLEKRPFAAHITLLRKAHAPRALPPLPALAWPVTEFVLVRSQLDANGSRYSVLERFGLR